MAKAIPCVIMRGGTSKAVFLRECDIPPPGPARDRVIRAVFGSPDARQIDGLGGADPLTSKLAIIGPSRDPRAQLTYTFAQVGIETGDVDLHSLCGNITSAVGAYAIRENMVLPQSPVTCVIVYNTNLDRLLTVEVPVRDGRVVEDGNYAVPGVPGSGARIDVDFADTAGAATGGLLPTGNPVDRLTVPGLGEIEASLVDIGNAHVFVRAGDVGMTGIESAAEIDRDAGLRDRLERIRAAAAEAMGMVASAATATRDTPATPIIGCVAPPAAYRSLLTGVEVAAEDCDLVSRLQFMQQTHKTYAGTSTACTGVASRLPGTIVHEVARQPADGGPALRIGHPGGVIVTEARVSLDGNDYVVERATLGRTARRIMEGTVYVADGAA